MQSAIHYGLDRRLEDVTQQARSTCSPGNCIWPTYESLAVCHRCINLDDEMERFKSHGTALWVALDIGYDSGSLPGNENTKFRLPNGLFIENQRGWVYNDHPSSNVDISNGVMVSAFGTSAPSKTVGMHDLDTLIWSMTMIRATGDPTNSSATWPELPRSSMECALYYCVNSYNTTVRNGVLQESATQVGDARRSPDSCRWRCRSIRPC